LEDDVSHVCSFAGRDPTLPDNKKEFNHGYSSFVGQAGDLGCVKYLSCAKPYISAIPSTGSASANALSPLALGRLRAEPDLI